MKFHPGASTSSRVLSVENEINSITNVYGDSVYQIVCSGTCGHNHSVLCRIRPPPLSTVALCCNIPRNYPDAPPSIFGTERADTEISQRVLELSREILAEIYRAGEPCIFNLLQELEKVIERGETTCGVGYDDEDVDVRDSMGGESQMLRDQEVLDPWSTPPWTLSPLLVASSSTFVARAAPVFSPDQAKHFLHHLLVSEHNVAYATHKITAWRIHGTNWVSYQGFDGRMLGWDHFSEFANDGGEAGRRLLHLMQLMDVWNVVVVVTRKHGGVLLGSGRFRIINATARHALVAAGFAADAQWEECEEMESTTSISSSEAGDNIGQRPLRLRRLPESRHRVNQALRSRNSEISMPVYLVSL